MRAVAFFLGGPHNRDCQRGSLEFRKSLSEVISSDPGTYPRESATARVAFPPPVRLRASFHNLVHRLLSRRSRASPRPTSIGRLRLVCCRNNKECIPHSCPQPQE